MFYKHVRGKKKKEAVLHIYTESNVDARVISYVCTPGWLVCSWALCCLRHGHGKWIPFKERQHKKLDGVYEFTVSLKGIYKMSHKN